MTGFGPVGGGSIPPGFVERSETDTATKSLDFSPGFVNPFKPQPSPKIQKQG